MLRLILASLPYCKWNKTRNECGIVENMQQFEPLTTNKVASARSVSETNQALDSQTQVQSVPMGLTTPKGDSKAKLRAMQLILQPVVAWVCLLATAKATGQFEFAYRYPAQAQILLAVVPQLILLFVGLRLRNPRLAFIAGLLFAVITAMISLTLVFSGLGYMAAAMMPFVAAGSAAIASRPDIRKRYMSAMVAAIAAFAAFITATSGVVSDTHGAGVSAAEAPVTVPAGLPPVNFRSENSGTLTIGNQDYQHKMVLESIKETNGIFPAERAFDKGMTLKSPDGTTQINIDSDGILQWKHGNQLVDIVDTSEVPISAVSMNADGNMLVFKQAGMYMVFTPSKGARGLEEVLNQFSGDQFQGDSQLGMILPEDIQGANWRPDGKQLTGRLSSGTFGDARFEFDVEKK
jgi:hypothetical protein